MSRHIAFDRCLLVLGCILICPVVSLAYALEPATPAGYSLVWADEFNGTSLNMDNWEVHYVGDSYSVGGGNLKLTTWTDTDGVTDRYGYIDTARGYQRTYGYFAARIKFNDKPGTASGFFIYSPYRAQGATEMDLIEHRLTDEIGRNVNDHVMTTVHWGPWEGPSKAFVDYTGTNIGDGDYHLLALDWTPTNYKFYLDNTLYWTCSKAISQIPEHMFLGCTPNGWAGPRPEGGYGPQGSPLNAVMTVDYVRVYAIPEPGSVMILSTALLGLLAYAWRRRR
jgi:beta-glucanase (GH16 family)